MTNLHAFLMFWCGGVFCMVMVLWSELKSGASGDAEEILRHTARSRPFELAGGLLLLVVAWPAFILWNTRRIELLKGEQRPITFDELPPPDPFDFSPGEGSSPKPLDILHRDTCALCLHARSVHGPDGCPDCFCHVFVRFGEGPEDCVCREWGSPHPGVHHPKCASLTSGLTGEAE